MMRILCPAMKSRPRWLQLKKKLNKEAIPKKKNNNKLGKKFA